MDFFKRQIEIKELPTNLRSDLEGYVWLSQFANINFDSKIKYIIDFSGVQWLSGNLCSAIGAVLDMLKSRKVDFEIKSSLTSSVDMILKRNNFLNSINGKKQSSTAESVIPYTCFPVANERKFKEYIYDYILDKGSIPKMTDLAKRKIYRSIFEIFENCRMHSDTSKVYICGQFFKGRGSMLLTIVDLGRSFKTNVTGHLDEFQHYTASECIEWAVELGHTTKDSEEPGGLGLNLIRDFLKMNHGKIQIVSGSGYWQEFNGKSESYDFEDGFEGTIVTLEFNLRDENKYYIEGEKKYENPF